MENIIIRPATLADMDALLRFEQGVIRAERPFDPTIKPDPVRYYNIHEMISEPHIQLLVAEINGEAIGSGYARIQDSKLFLTPVQNAYLGFMFVDDAHRGKGVNGLIMNALREWVLSNGITELQLEVYYENSPAVKAYEKVGFSKSMIKMRMGL
ncbi:acetyltransferase [Mucilaginibacter sp. PAMC 26640]|nr:acetyltransferase [Mucilaginibacter sp. PAMC 26640]